MIENNGYVLEKVEKKAHDYEYRYHGCGQCVLRALQEDLNLLAGPDILRTAGFTGAGMARMQHMFGALMAGIMAIHNIEV